jgi:hypothetical protein
VADVLIRDVPDRVLEGIDANAKRVGLSRTEYLRRQLVAASRGGTVTAGDLAQFSATFADLGDPTVMRQAWT